jgi:hypothetical protein
MYEYTVVNIQLNRDVNGEKRVKAAFFQKNTPKNGMETE